MRKWLKSKMKGIILILAVFLIALLTQVSSVELTFPSGDTVTLNVITATIGNGTGWNQTGSRLYPSDAAASVGSNVLSCTEALETNAAGDIVCGTDASGSSDIVFNLNNISNSSNTKLNNGSSANLTDLIVSGYLNISKALNATGNITFSQLKSCDTINSDANGLLTCGSDATGAVGDFSNFQLSNVSNNTLVKGDNSTLALWNYTTLNSNKQFIFPRYDLVRIGNFTTAQENNTFTVTGNVNVYGSLNATNINATNITSTGLYVDAGTLFVDSDNSRVGIGTTGPVTKLTVSGSGALSGAVIRVTDSSTSYGLQLSGDQGGTQGVGYIGNRLSVAAATAGDEIIFSDGTSFLSSDGAQSGSVTRMFISNSGNVGIGTTNPTDTLTVDGELNVTGNASLGTQDVLFVDNTSSKVGIGTTSPANPFHLSVTPASDVAAARITVYTGSSGAIAGLAAGLQGQKARGTSASPSAVLADDNLLSYSGQGYHSGGAFGGNTGLFGLKAAEDFTSTAQGSYWVWETTPTGSTSRTERIRIAASGNVGIGTTSPGRLLEVAGSINGTQLNISGAANLAYGSGSVGIGTHQPNDKLEVIGNVRVSGSLNASFINASFFKQGTKDVASVGDFDLRNISNYTQYIKGADFNLGNISNLTKTSSFSILFGNFTKVNSSNISATNITSDRFTGKLDCGMIDGGSDADFCTDGGGAGDSSNFQLANVSNNTLVKGDNISISFWNLTSFTSSLRFVYSHDLVRIGNFTVAQINDTFTVKGSSAFYGSLNSTSFNSTLIIGTSIFIGTKEIQASSDFNLNNISNASNTKLNNGSSANLTDLMLLGFLNISKALNVTGNITFAQLRSCDTINTDANGLLTCGEDATGTGESSTPYWQKSNESDFHGQQNGSILITNNLTNILKDTSNFQLGNVSNNTLTKGDNATTALWNITNSKQHITPVLFINLSSNPNGMFNISLPTNFTMLSVNGLEIRFNSSSIQLKGATGSFTVH